jgi:hypothetical protein
MRPTPDQQLALEAMLNGFLGAAVYDRLCLGMTVGSIDEGILNIFVSTENCAADIEHNYSDEFAIAAEHVFRLPIRSVNILPRDFSDSTER